MSLLKGRVAWSSPDDVTSPKDVRKCLHFQRGPRCSFCFFSQPSMPGSSPASLCSGSSTLVQYPARSHSATPVLERRRHGEHRSVSPEDDEQYAVTQDEPSAPVHYPTLASPSPYIPYNQTIDSLSAWADHHDPDPSYPHGSRTTMSRSAQRTQPQTEATQLGENLTPRPDPRPLPSRMSYDDLCRSEVGIDHHFKTRYRLMNRMLFCGAAW